MLFSYKNTKTNECNSYTNYNTYYISKTREEFQKRIKCTTNLLRDYNRILWKIRLQIYGERKNYGDKAPCIS